MEVVIKVCPACDQLLVDDSGSCPACGVELSRGDAQALSGESGAVAAPQLANEMPCLRCGTSVSKTLVRCPACQSLMQHDRLGRAEARVRTAELAGVDDFDLLSDVQLVEDPALMAEIESRAYHPHEETTDGDDFEVGGGASVVEFDQSAAYLSAPSYVGNAEAGLVEIDEDSRRWEREAALQAEEAGPAAYDLTQPEYGDPGELPPDDGQWNDQENYDQQAYAEQGYADDSSVEQPVDQYADQYAGDEAPPVQDEAEPPAPVADPLLAAALEEQAESGRSRGRSRRPKRELRLAADAFLVYCPNGHRIVVREQYRGRVGRCPNCRAPFFVPTESIVEESGVTEATMPVGDVVGAYDRWVVGARLHAVNPTKLKLKEGSCVGTHDVVDLGFALDQALLAIVFPGNTAFRGMVETKKTTANRESLRTHLRGGGSLDQMPVKFAKVDPAQFGELRLVQPAIPGDETIFAGVPVFGPGMIVVRIPAAETVPTERQYLSLTLSQFRTLAEVARERYGVAEIAPSGLVPLAEEFESLVCHYSDQPIQALKAVELYRQDPSFKLKLLGWKCEGCGLIVSEDSRKKEKIGGKAESSVAKAKCPKCKNKFGDSRLYGL